MTRVEMLLRESKEFSTFTKTTALAYLGTTHSPPPQMGAPCLSWVRGCGNQASDDVSLMLSWQASVSPWCWG